MSEDSSSRGSETTRRDFMVLTATSMTAVAAACSLWPLVDSMNPSSDVLALSSVEVDLSNIQEGQSITVKWQGKPVFIRHRTAAEIEEANVVNVADLKDPQTDDERVKTGHEKWLVTIGICTHLGCVPIAEHNGWFCPCHGSVYDTSGRIRKGPAPTNLEIPPYEFISETKIKIG